MHRANRSKYTIKMMVKALLHIVFLHSSSRTLGSELISKNEVILLLNVFQVNVGCVPKKVHFSLFLMSQLAIEKSSTLH